ncbi:hypothetical protein C5746_04510 [Streptomyces atratus]|uniref:Uncharacterized protein n=1 Tax=Streptomyces atratus TaxID=1893 RepID=A0A2Z5J7P3_STRAR|nr:hypothetical protein C5746_04510 [Streptomyces atratus]
MYDGGADDTSGPLPGTINSEIIPDRSANVTTPVIALIRPKPDLDLVAGEPTKAIAAAQAAAGQQHAKLAHQLHQLLPVRHGTDVG